MTAAVREDVALGLCAALSFNFSEAVGSRLDEANIRDHTFTPADILSLRFDPGQEGIATKTETTGLVTTSVLPETTKIYAEVEVSPCLMHSARASLCMHASQRPALPCAGVVCTDCVLHSPRVCATGANVDGGAVAEGEDVDGLGDGE